MTWIRRHRALIAGLVAGLVAAVAVAWLLDPARWLRPGLGRVYVIGTCSYSKAALDILRADPELPYVPLALPADEPAFEADACDLAVARLRRGGAFWLAVLPRTYVCTRLRALAAARRSRETSGEGYPAWVSAAGEFVGLGVDPRQVAALELTPPPAVVRFWIEGGYDRGLVESLGFTVPEGTVQGPRPPPPDPGP